MDTHYEIKLKKARKIIEVLKADLLNQLTELETNQYCNSRLSFPWIEEDTEYLIKKLNLNKRDESEFIRQVHRILGVYSEVIPYLDRNEENNNSNLHYS